MRTRTQNAKINIFVGFVSKAILLVAAFTSRTVFIRLLGAEYVGISGLYSNILGILNLADMGMLGVLSYELYESLKYNDVKKIASLVDAFKRIYVIIIGGILVVGLALVPFLHFIVNNSKLSNIDLILYYILYLLDSVASYFFVYRTTVISADQKNYIINIVQMGAKFVMYIAQILFLIFTRNFLGYLIIQIFFTFLSNTILHIIATKLYPFLKDKHYVDKSLINYKEIFGNIKGTFLAKTANTILSQTDNIIISVMFGTVFVGYYSNYNSLNVYICSIMSILVTSITASVGNLIAEKNIQKSYEMFKNFMFGFTLVTTFSATCILCLIQDFIPIWIGKNYLMDFNLVLAIVFVFYQGNSSNVIEMYRSAMGIFKEVQYMYLVSAVINILLSVGLGKVLGISGVIYATGVSRLLTTFWYDSGFVMKKMGKNNMSYFLLQGKHYLTSIVIMVVSYLLCSFIPCENLLWLFLKAFVCGCITILFEFLVNIKTTELTWFILQFKVRFFNTKR